MSSEQTEVLVVPTPHGTELKMPVAGVGARSYAFIIDWHIRTLVALVWILGYLLYRSQVEEISDGLELILLAIPGVFYFLYHPVIELIMEGNSPGKKYAKVRIVTLDGEVPGNLAILIRNIMRLLDSLPTMYLVGIVACVTTDKSRRIGDIAAGTLLVYEAEDDGLIEGIDELLTSDLTLKQINAIRTLTTRWNELESETRCRLARQLLRKLDRSPSVNWDDDDLLAELESLVPGSPDG